MILSNLPPVDSIQASRIQIPHSSWLVCVHSTIFFSVVRYMRPKSVSSLYMSILLLDTCTNCGRLQYLQNILNNSYYIGSSVNSVGNHPHSLIILTMNSHIQDNRLWLKSMLACHMTKIRRKRPHNTCKIKIRDNFINYQSTYANKMLKMSRRILSSYSMQRYNHHPHCKQFPPRNKQIYGVKFEKKN